MVVDVEIVFSGFIGGAGAEVLLDTAVDTDGTVVVVGDTDSFDFPDTVGLPGPSGGEDAFVTCIDPDAGAIVYSVIVGGTGSDSAVGVALDPQGRAVAVGRTESSDFPFTPGAFDTTTNASSIKSDAFAFKLRSDGSGFVYSTFLGGSQEGLAYDVAVDANGEAAVVGWTESNDFPTTTGAFQESAPPAGFFDADGFVVRLTSDGSAAAFSTYLGGDVTDKIRNVVLASNGDVVVAGYTDSESFPTTPGAYLTGGGSPSFDGFVTRLSSDGTRLVWSTLVDGLGIGGTNDIALTWSEDVVVVGITGSDELPVTPGAIQAERNGVWDGFLVKLAAAGDNLLAATYLGGQLLSMDGILDVALDPSGVATVVGIAGTDFPTTAGSWNPGPFASADGYLSRISPDGTRLLYSTLWGGSFSDKCQAVARYDDGSFVMTGQTSSEDFPVTVETELEPFPSGVGWVTVFDPVPQGVTRYGDSTDSCLGPIELGLTPMPIAGDMDVVLFSSSAPPDAIGMLVVGLMPDPIGFSVLGADLHVAPLGPLFLIPTSSGSDGYAEIPHPIPSELEGATLYEQVLWLNPAGCGSPGFLSASQALAVTVQPAR